MTHPLKEAAAELPDKPGIYIFKNARGEPVYIGKARSLADRVKTYFQPSDDPKVGNILAETTRLDFLLTASEREAAFLENNFIQHYQPKFNLRLKDDKSFPYLRLTVQEAVPGVFFSRKVASDGARYFGPFSPAREAGKTLQLLTKSFRLRSCAAAVFRARKRPCLEFELGNCSAPCVGRIGDEDYAASVRDAVFFLEGRTQELAKTLRERMNEAAAAERFEDAARHRDLLKTIEQIRSRPKAISVRLENQDIIGCAQAGPLRTVHVFHMRGGKVRESKEFVLERDPSLSPEEALREFLDEFYSGHPLPDKIIVPTMPSGAAALRAGWNAVAKRGVILSVPQRGDGRTLLEWAVKNAEILLRKTSDEHVAVEELKSVLGLRALPVRIDGFDVSHTQGVETVAALVTFLIGRPWKDGYRRYRIRTARKSDDTAALSEALERRFTRIIREGQPLADFVLVDGGLPQLHAGRAVLAGLGLPDLPIGALAKREEIIYTPDRPEGIRLEGTSPALKLVQHIRDEAHRFAVAFHRKRRSKRSFS
jgi:excinuclease ABC subunit C